jgi:hypothetical protein
MKIADTADMKKKNATLFRNFMAGNGITQDKLEAKIGQYVGKNYPAGGAAEEHNRIVARSNLRKELARDSMSTKLLVKALTMCGCGKLTIDGMLEMRG